MARSLILIVMVMVSACSGSIHRSVRLPNAEPHVIAVDARQRFLISQARRQSPNYRQYCAEPPPDVFTTLGVAASGGVNADLTGSGPRNVSAALQAAFSSSETGATIARTQTIQMLREMMFRTCERYLSGAVDAEEFAIIASRDQRIMVSVLAIEQLTGAITPRSVSIGTGGASTTGLNSTEVVKLVAEGQVAVQAADEDVAKKKSELAKADVPTGNCETLRKKKADAKEALSATETTALAACDKAQSELAAIIAKRDVAQARYDDLVAASKRGSGISSASTSGTVNFGSDTARSEAAVAIAASVEEIVAQTFDQDETQLMCIRTLSGTSKLSQYEQLAPRCMQYLLGKVDLATAELGLSRKAADAATDAGVRLRIQFRLLAIQVRACAGDAMRFKALQDATKAQQVNLPAIRPDTPILAVQKQIFDLGEDNADKLRDLVATRCME